jgi:hypothetical protein
MASLGFNPNRKYHASTLPGAITTMPARRPRGGVARVARPPPSRVERGATPAVPVAPPPARTAPAAPTAPAPSAAPPAAPAPAATEHWTYATALAPLRSAEDDDIVAVKGARVVLVHPMRSDPDTGMVTMMLKRVHAVTGQLSYHWVRVYDPNTDTHFAGDFALVA